MLVADPLFVLWLERSARRESVGSGVANYGASHTFPTILRFETICLLNAHRASSGRQLARAELQ